jgi:hypothetical protein
VCKVFTSAFDNMQYNHMRETGLANQDWVYCKMVVVVIVVLN